MNLIKPTESFVVETPKSNFGSFDHTESKNAAIIKDFKTQQIKDIRSRSSYSASSALRFKNVFDDCIADGLSRGVPIKNEREETFQTKIADALKYMINNWDHEHLDYKNRKHNVGDYAKLRARVKMRLMRGKGYILIDFTVNVQAYESVVMDPRSKKEIYANNWRETLFNFFECPVFSKPLSIKDILLSDEEVNFVKERVGDFADMVKEQAEVTSVVESNQILVILVEKTQPTTTTESENKEDEN